jgi:hypothetical protein
MEAAALTGTGAVEWRGRSARTAVAAESQLIVEVAQEAEQAVSQQAARQPVTCASAPFLAVPRVSPMRMIRAIERAGRSPAAAVGRPAVV